MLAGAAKHNIRYGTPRRFGPSSTHLYLPWLCPAQLRHESFSRQLRSGSGDSMRRTWRQSSSSNTRSSRRRCLATATGERTSRYENSIPFEGQGSSHFSGSSESPWLGTGLLPSNPRPFDPWSPIIINESVIASRHHLPPRHRRAGDPTEIQRTLEACLKVQRFERATALLRRLISVCDPDSPVLLDSFNEYLSASAESLRQTRSSHQLRVVQKWFEVEMRGGGVRPNAITFALLIKASLQVLQGPRIERTIRRYMDLAAQSQLHFEVLNLPILSDPELYKVTECCPTDFNNPSGVLEAAYPEPEGAEKLRSTRAHDNEQERTMPEVMGAQQKGLGLETLRKSISVFDGPMGLPETNVAEGLDIPEAVSTLRQERLERDAVSAAVDRWREEHQKLQRLGVESALRRRTIGALMWDWQVAMTPLIQKELHLLERAEAKEHTPRSDLERSHYGPFLRLLPHDKLSAVTILATMSAISLSRFDRGVKISSLIVAIGNAVQDEVLVQYLQRKDPKPLGYLSSADRQQKLTKLLKRGNIAKSIPSLLKKSNKFDNSPVSTELRPWDNVAKGRVGAALLSILIEASKVPVTRHDPENGKDITKRQPAFYHAFRYLHGKRVGFVGAHSQLVEQLSQEPVHFGLAKNLPMIVEPQNWTGLNSGGYLQTPVRMVRNKVGDLYQNQYIKAASQRGDLAQVFAGLDVLAKTPWKINKAVLEIMLRVWNSGEELGTIPPADPQLAYPREPDPSASPAERFRWIKAVREIENLRAGYHSQRCFQNFQLEIARAFRNEKLYFPHSLDFRGRAYPVPPHLNHMGADNARGLLMFAEAKELGHTGLDWLKVHIANLYGFDKASLIERREYVMQHLSDVCDSANNPLDGRKWWLKAEDPWQCLAACMELKSALELPDPATYKSHLPIHQDGTCNGLQHYAALGGDLMGARQVNLEPGDRPADVYTGVAEIVKKEIAEDSKAGNEIAKALVGNITRKVVKQNVMTNVYGVTFTGASAQVRKQLAVLMPDHNNDSSQHLGILAGFVARKIFKALSTMFSGAREIQNWLGQCGNRITQSISPEQMQKLERDFEARQAMPRGRKSKTEYEKCLDDHTRFLSTLIWTTPLKMPVVQPYRGTKSRLLKCTIQSVHIKDPRASDPVDKRRQLQGFPPNFIHSLDATHMLLSALQCNEAGLTFAAVHDSFWTHACDVDKMNTVLRDAFIRVHGEDVIGRLESEFKARYQGYLYAAKVRPNSKTAKKIRAWREKHWGTTRLRAHLQIQEILLERKRMQSLLSTEPREQEHGRKMVTPGSILEESLNQEDLVQPDELAGHGIGEIASRSSQSNSEDIEAQPNDESTNVDADLGLGDEVEAMHPAPKQSKPGAQATTATGSFRVWLPLTFPPKPARGDFDIQRLKDSQYFFS